jgi:uncharacterized delta-60 repeat protein
MSRRQCFFTITLALLLLTAAEAGSRVVRYDGPSSGWDYASDVAVDTAGNVYVTGGSSGNGTGLDFTVLCLSPGDSLRWVYRWNHTGSSDDVARAVAIGPDGNIYAAGYTVNPAPYYDVVVLSLTPDGQLRWDRVHQSQFGGEDSASAIAVDGDGNIYTAGTGDDIEGSSTEFVVLSFEPDTGGLRWVYATSAGYVDEATDVVVGPDSTVFASGVLWSGSSPSAFTVTAVNSATGVERWQSRYVYGDNTCRADGVAYGNGKVYASGYADFDNWDFTVMAFDANSGAQDWAWYYSNYAEAADRAWDVIVGTDGNVYSCGRTMDSTGTQRFTVAGIDPAGATRWLYRKPGGALGRFEQANELVQGPNGHLYACGWTDSIWPYEGDEALVVSLDTAGSVRWVYSYDQVPESVDVAQAIAVGPNGRVYVAGTSWAAGSGLDIVVLSLDPTGIEEAPNVVVRTPNTGPTIVRGVLFLPTASSRKPQAPSRLLDISGKKVLDLKPGPNDVSRLSPGVYFVRGAQAQAQAPTVRRVVILP